MAYLGLRKSLGKKMMGHKKPMGMNTLGAKMPGSEAPVDILTQELSRQKKSDGLVRVRRNGGYSSLGNYAGG